MSLRGWLAAGLLAAAVPALAAAAAERNARVFDRVWTLVERHYWNDDRLGARWAAARARYRPHALAAADGHALYAVLDRMVAEIGDSHVFVVDPARRAYERARSGRDPAGIGELGFASWAEGGGRRVFAVTPGGPAARAGVRIGWRLIAIDGRPIDEDWHPRAGAATRLDFVDEAGAQRTLDLVAGPLVADVPGRARRLADGTLLIELDGFERGADRWLRDAIAGGPPPRALVLDLRENGGGEAIAVARVAGLFFAARRTLIEEIGRGRPRAVPILRHGRDHYAGPLAMLVGQRSASGAEALAALIAESGRGITVGERTAGALTGAALFALPDGGALSVAEFDIRTAGGRRLEGTGFVPGHVVPRDDAALARGDDLVLAAALRLLRAASDG